MTKICNGIVYHKSIGVFGGFDLGFSAVFAVDLQGQVL